MNLDEIKETLWLYSTHENHPTQVDEAYANLRDGGGAVVDGLIWALQQDDLDLTILALQLLEMFYTHSMPAFSSEPQAAVRALISDEEDRLVRLTAINTANVIGDTSEDLIPLLTPRLESEDKIERIVAAGHLWRLNRSEDAYFVLRREAAREEMAKEFLDTVEFPIRPEMAGDRKPIRRVHQCAFGRSDEANLVDSLRDGGFVEASLVAETDGQVIAHILFSHAKIVTSSRIVDALSLAPISVLPCHQRKGIGTRLALAGLEVSRKNGHRIALIPAHLFSKFEFEFSPKRARRIESPIEGGEAWMAFQLWPNSLKGINGRVEFSPPFGQSGAMTNWNWGQ